MTTTLKPVYNASALLTVTNLKSLASSATWIAGWSSAVIANGTNLSVSEKITGLIKTGTSPTAGTNILVYIWSALDDTPTYPDTITGSEGTVSITSANVLATPAFKLGGVITVDATTGRVYPFSIDVASLFGGHMPKNYGVYIAHNTAVILDATTQVVSRGDVTQYQNI